MKLKELKTLWQILQDLVNKDYYSIHDFLNYATEQQKKEIDLELVEIDQKQYYKYLDSKKFKNKDELETAICEYEEYTNQQPLGMGEMLDISDMADDYAKERKLPFYED